MPDQAQNQQQPKKLLDQLSDAMRTKQYSPRTIQTYTEWVRRYILFHKKRHPKDMGEADVQAFITCISYLSRSFL